MEIKTLNCEEEPIHLCGRIQNFGYLIVFDISQKCIAISDNCKEWLSVDSTTLINKDIKYFLDHIESDDNISFEQEDIAPLIHRSLTHKVRLNNNNYQLTIYINNEQIFFEFEKKDAVEIELKQLNSFQQKFDDSDNIWQTLCDNIYDIIGFERIMVYRFLEDGSGTVVAENMREHIEPLLGYHYPDFDIPAQARQLYVKNLSRQCPDIHAETINIHGLSAIKLDLSKSQVRALSPIHLQYLDNFGVKASASFSIIINNKLWGLVACQHLTPKFIPYDQRSLCLFVTQYAANKYLVKKQNVKLEQNHLIKEIELELKEKLFYNQSLETTLNEFAMRFMHVLNSDGLIIKSPDYLLRYGDTPNDQTLNEIHPELNKLSENKSIYTTYFFSTPNHRNNSGWAGIARISFDKEHSYTVYWFRKEIFITEKWAGIPEKFPTYSEEKQAYIYSPRTSFQAWMREVKGQSEKWSQFDKEFLARIHKLIQDSIIRKMTEIKKLNEKLIEINNKLETYTHELGHDIKNPLTTIKTSAQFIRTRNDLSQEMISKFSTNILEAATLINDIMDKTLESTRSHLTILPYEKIATDGLINQIIYQAADNYQVQNFKLKLGELLPVYGDKTLLYQLFMNLINNAIKFSSKQELTNLEVYSTQEGLNTIYYIRDNGIGIAEAERSNIFSIFRRLSNAGQFEGSGVGMSIVRRIVDRLNAHITFDSEIGAGTTFKISFPNKNNE